jgi:alpha-ketoglutarate-dependent taurine dioxygenase
VICRPVLPGVRLAGWGLPCAPVIARAVQKGAVLFRDFSVDGVDAFDAFAGAIGGAAVEYVERTSPRTAVTATVLTSTDHPASESILLHNENSYAHAWPLRMFFYCETPASKGGATPLADSRSVLQRLDRAIVDAFRAKGVRYIRNYADHLGLPWQTSFQAAARTAVDEYCRAAGLTAEWRSRGTLRTTVVRPATARHPVTGEEVWFNQALLFHASSLPAVVRDGLGDVDDEDAPTHATYGDGSPIPAPTMAAIAKAYADETTRVVWRHGDVLAVDNMLVAHGREPFEGPRRVLVSMRHRVSWADLRTDIRC